METTIKHTKTLSTEQFLGLPDVKKVTLPNGIDVHTLRTKISGLSKLIIAFPAGKKDHHNPALPDAAFSLIKKGVKGKTPGHFSEEMEQTGMICNTSVNNDYSTLSAIFLEEEDTHSLQLISEMIYQPLYDNNEIQRYIQKHIQAYEVNQQKTTVRSREIFMQQLFGNNHSLGKIINHTHYEGIAKEMLTQYHQQHILPTAPEIFLASGNPDRMVGAIEQYFKHQELKTTKEKTHSKSAIHGTPPTYTHLEMPQAQQTSLRIGKKLFAKADPDYPGMELLITLLGGYFSSRLMANLREDKGYTYGVGARIIPFANTGIITIATDIGHQYRQQGIDEIQKEIKMLQKERISADELETVKRYMTGSILRSLDGAFNKLSAVAELCQTGVDIPWVSFAYEKMRNTGSEEIMELANKYLILDELTTVTAGKTIQNTGKSTSL